VKIGGELEDCFELFEVPKVERNLGKNLKNFQRNSVKKQFNTVIEGHNFKLPSHHFQTHPNPKPLRASSPKNIAQNV
jgi:hypothetical protein